MRRFVDGLVACADAFDVTDAVAFPVVRFGEAGLTGSSFMVVGVKTVNDDAGDAKLKEDFGEELALLVLLALGLLIVKKGEGGVLIDVETGLLIINRGVGFVTTGVGFVGIELVTTG